MIGKGFNIFTYKFKPVLTMPILKILRIVGSFILIFTNRVLFVHLDILLLLIIIKASKVIIFLKNQSI